MDGDCGGGNGGGCDDTDGDADHVIATDADAAAIFTVCNLAYASADAASSTSDKADAYAAAQVNADTDVAACRTLNPEAVPRAQVGWLQANAEAVVYNGDVPVAVVSNYEMAAKVPNAQGGVSTPSMGGPETDESVRVAVASIHCTPVVLPTSQALVHVVRILLPPAQTTLPVAHLRSPATETVLLRA